MTPARTVGLPDFRVGVKFSMSSEDRAWPCGIAPDPMALIPVYPNAILAGHGLTGQSAGAPHFLGILIVTSLVGMAAGAAALLSGLSILMALGIYSGVGCGLFGLSLIGRALMALAQSARPLA